MHDYLTALARGPHDYQRQQAARNVDALAEIRATIKALQAQEQDLAAAIKATGFERVEGSIARATITLSESSRTDWKTVALQFDPPTDLIARHTQVSVVCSVRTYPLLQTRS
jgi:hypothetical protein